MTQDVIEQHIVPYPVLPAGMTDQQFVDLWLRRYKESTRETYKSAAYRFLFFLDETRLNQVSVDMLLDFEESLGYLGAATKIRIFRTVQSLYHFAKGTGYVSLNVGAFIRIPQATRKLSQRILSETQVHSIRPGALGWQGREGTRRALAGRNLPGGPGAAHREADGKGSLW